MFETAVRPLLAAQCVSCHGTEKQKGGLRLDQPQFIAQGGDSGIVIVPGSPDKSLLYQAIRYGDDGLKMPPRGKLTDEQIQKIGNWIQGGASLPKASPSVDKPVQASDLAKRKAYWSYQPLLQSETPINNVQNPVDALLLSLWKKRKLSPASKVTKSVWLR
ncbi:MAG TPA: c-type cytochrome, partial [Gemmatales bacterium]|nr:c-type cytochrome [Gemmatales bacterium]